MGKKSKEAVAVRAPQPSVTAATPDAPDLAVAEAAWQAISAKWPTTGVTTLAGQPRRNVEWVVPQVRASLARLRKGAWGAALSKLPSFDAAHVDDLATTLDALWYARVRYRQVASTESGAKVSATDLEKARTLRGRMFRCAEYNLGDDPAVRAELDDIAAVEGSVYLDLAMDLQRLAALYEDPDARVELAKDRKLYRADDARDASQRAGALLAQLGSAKGESAKWAREVARGWSALVAHYAEVAAAGRFLERHSGDADALWPSLYAIVRLRRAATPEGDPTPAPQG
jgi:hypothetical protein